MNNLFNTCYLCLTPSSNLTPLYHGNGEDCNKIKYILPELVIFEPEVPQSVCCSCLVTTTFFYLFKKKCLENNQHLMYIVNKRHQQEQQQEQQQQQLLEQQQQYLIQQQQQHPQLEHQQHQQQISNGQTFQFPQQPRQIETTKPILNCSAGTTLLSNNDVGLQKNLVDVINIDEDDDASFNYAKLSEKQISEQFINNELNSNNLQIQDSFSLFTGHKQTNSVVNSKDGLENIAPFYASNIRSNHGSQVINQSKNIETKTESICKNAEPTKNNFFEHNICVTETPVSIYNNTNSNENYIQLTGNQNDDEERRSKVVENISSFCDRQLPKNQNIIETRPAENYLDNRLNCTNIETENSDLISKEKHGQKPSLIDNIERKQEAVSQNKLICPEPQTLDSLLLSAEEQPKKSDVSLTENVNSFCKDITKEQNYIEPRNTIIDDIEIKENFDAFSGQQLTNKQKYIETRRLEEIFENELKCSKKKIKPLVSQSTVEHSQKNAKEDVNNIKENFSSFRIDSIDLEARKQEAVNDNYSSCFNLERNEDSVSLPTANCESQQISNEQKDLETRNTKTEKKHLPSLKIEIENSVSLPAEECSNNDVKRNFCSLQSQLLSNLQKILGTRNTEAEKNHLSSLNIEIKDSVSSQSAVEHSQKNAKEDVNNIKENFSSFRIDSIDLEARKQEAVNDNYLSCFKVERNEDSVSLPTANCESQQISNDQNDLESNNTEVENELLPSRKIEFEDSVTLSAEESSNGNNNDVKGNFASLHTQQLLNKTKDLETRNTEAEKEHLPSLKIEIEDSLSVPAEESSNNDVKRNFSSLHTQQISNEQKDLETRNTKTEKEIENCVSLPAEECSNNDVERNFSSLQSQLLSNLQKILGTRNTEAEKNHLSSLEKEIEDSVSLQSSVEHSQKNAKEDVNNIKENFSSFRIDSIDLEARKQKAVNDNYLSCFKVERNEDSVSLPTANCESQQISNDQNDLESNNTEVENELLPSLEIEFEDSVALSAEESSNGNNNDVKGNFASLHTQQLLNKTKDLETRNTEAEKEHLPSLKIEIEDSLSVPAEESSNNDVRRNFSSLHTQQISNEQKDLETRNTKTEKEIGNYVSLPAEECSNNDVKLNFSSLQTQLLLNLQKILGTRNTEAERNHLSSLKIEIEDSVSLQSAVEHSQKNAKEDVNNIKNSDLISKEKHGQKPSLIDNIERKQEAVSQNKLKCSEPQTLDSLLLCAEEQPKKSDASLTENVNSSCKDITLEQNYIDPRNTIIDDIEIKENFDAFSGQQLTNKQKYIETRRLEEIFENELKCSKKKIKPLVSQSTVEHSQKNAKEDVNNRKENFSSFRIDSMGLEARKQEAVNDNYSSCFNLERNEDSVSLPTANKSQQISNEQNDLESNNTEVENELLPSLEIEFEDSVTLSAEESSNGNNNDVKGYFASLHTQQLSNKQKDLETRNTEAEKENLPSLKIEIEDSLSVPVEESANNDVKRNFSSLHTQQISNEQKDLETRNTKTEKEIENSVSLPVEECSNNDVKRTFSSLQTQLLSNLQKILGTRNTEAEKNDLSSLEIEIEDSVSLQSAVEHSQKKAKVDVNNTKENFSSFRIDSIDLEARKQETVNDNYSSCFNLERNEDSVSLPTANCESQQISNEQNDLESNNTEVENELLPSLKIEFEDSVTLSAEESSNGNNNDVKGYFASLHTQQLLNKTKDLKTRNTEAEKELLPSLKIEIEDSLSVPAEESANNDVKINFSSLHTQQISNERKDLETRNTKTEKEIENSVSLPAEECSNNDVKRNFSSLQTQLLSNLQKILGTRNTEAEKNHLSSSKIEIEDSVSLPAEENSNNNVKRNFSSFHTRQISNKQKDLAEKEHLPSLIIEIEDSISLPEAEESSVEDEQKDSASNQEADLKNHLPCSKIEIEDSNSVPEEEDTERYSFTEDFEVKEEFVSNYSSDSKFYRELVKSINSDTSSNNSEVPSSSSIVNTLIYNFYRIFYNKSGENNGKTCPICAEVLSVDSMPNHLKTHVSKNHFDKCKCSICDETLLKGMLPRHLDKHRKKHLEIVECPVCFKEMIRKSLPRHFKIHGKRLIIKRKTFNCNICNKKYKYESYFEQHKKMHSQDKKDWQFKCEICKKKFYFKDGFKTHMKFHTGDKNFKCTVCDKKFLYEAQIKQHQKSHAEKPPPKKKIWKCSDCGKIFVRQSNLDQHRKIHIGIKKYECKLCNMKFLHGSHLKQHEYTHTGAKRKKFKCTVCKKSFLYNGTLKKHMETHDDEGSNSDSEGSDSEGSDSEGSYSDSEGSDSEGSYSDSE